MSAVARREAVTDGGDVAMEDVEALWKESESRSNQRFSIELEFVQCLANPKYLLCTCDTPCFGSSSSVFCPDWPLTVTMLVVFHALVTAVLAQHPKKYFDDPAFVAYLQYLQYWKTAEYAKYIR